MTARSLRPFPVFFVRLMRGRPYWGCAGGTAVCALRCLAIGWAGEVKGLWRRRGLLLIWGGGAWWRGGWWTGQVGGIGYLERPNREAPSPGDYAPHRSPESEPEPFDREQPSTQGAVHLRRPCLAEWYFGSRDKAALARRFIYLSSSSLAAQVPPPSAGGALDAHLPEGVGASAQQFRAEARTPRYSCESTS